MSTCNGFNYPEYPTHLPPLDCISERLISPRLPFMQIRRLRNAVGNFGVVGQVVNVPVDVNTMVTSLPRHLHDDHAINVHIKRHVIHKSSYLTGIVKKRTVKAWLRYLHTTPLYKQYNVVIDQNFLNETDEVINGHATDDMIESCERDASDYDMMLAQQHTMLWNEDKYLSLCPGANQVPLSLLFDEHAEELSFPAIYLGQPRTFTVDRVTAFMLASSEIRRKDRRGATPQHILYMAMKVLRIRIRDGMQVTFRSTRDTAGITKRMIEDIDFIETCVNNSLSFLRTIPNSLSYWSARKKDVFSMMRQLGKPTVFLTLSSSEFRWPDLLHLLYRLRNDGAPFHGDPLNDMTALQRTELVNQDPVTCVLYFNKLVDVFLAILKHRSASPFGDYRVLDFFKRIEFQHRGSAHAHILLWLDNDPHEEVSEHTPNTCHLIDSLVSLEHKDILPRPDDQHHSHTFTCYKKAASKCRFGAPFWPMTHTRVLLPMSTDDERRKLYQDIFHNMHDHLETRSYDSLEAFLAAHDMDETRYLDVIRAGIKRPMVFLKRRIDQIWVSPFNPYIGTKLRSNMDLQYILEEYSCATYVLDYINKTNRGVSDLHRKLIQLREQYPDADYTDTLKKLGMDVLNSVEMSSQEAAWYLLRLAMSKSSRDIVFIPSCWYDERQRVKKTRAQLRALDDEDTNVWKETCIEKYERRPPHLEDVTLSQFSAHYYNKRDGSYARRSVPRVIRYIGYDPAKQRDYQREIVLLNHPFRSEVADILDCDKFATIYNDNKVLLHERMQEFCSNLDIQKTLQICEALHAAEPYEAHETSALHAGAVIGKRNAAEAELEQHELRTKMMRPNNDDICEAAKTKLSAVVKKRDNVMSAEEFRYKFRMVNRGQYKLLLHCMHCLIPYGEGHSLPPLQIFLTGPAGSGKTFVMRLMMDIVNRLCTSDDNTNAYIACASTGKAATAIDGTTIHSAFRIVQARRHGPGMNVDTVSMYRSGMRDVVAVFVDEVSMIGADILIEVNRRLQQICFRFDVPFGGLHMILCGDLRQLPPVRARPIYKRDTKSLAGSETIWQMLNFYPFTEVMRQSDVAFSTVLTKIGDGDRLTQEETDFIESRFVTKSEAEQCCPDAIRLFLKNCDVTAYNNMVLSRNSDVFTSVAKDVMIGYKDANQEASMRSKIHKMTVAETAGLAYKVSLVPEKKYMITANIDVADGLTNGSMCTLKHIELQEDGLLHRVPVLPDASSSL
ncbi:uncharacterized protein LOC119432693 [Dermacentor silvarum]|uniref:uncharacterized protein LOC119432693 n=1 Tax=Dermacentor silvarum TaxID=543639 RepID=UPI0021015931|nr:uncharacterized protein LOC119432693 [Dermacentor silvarum]